MPRTAFYRRKNFSAISNHKTNFSCIKFISTNRSLLFFLVSSFNLRNDCNIPKVECQVKKLLTCGANYLRKRLAYPIYIGRNFQMRIANMKFMVSFPNLSAAFCQVNFSRRLRYQNVKRRQTAAAYPALMARPRYGIALGSWNSCRSWTPHGSWKLELQLVRELQFTCAHGAGERAVNF